MWFMRRRCLTSHDTGDQLLVAIIQHDLTTVRYILEAHRSYSFINRNFFFRTHQNELNHSTTLLGIKYEQISSIRLSSVFSSRCLSLWFI
jgi:hypothetical protein